MQVWPAIHAVVQIATKNATSEGLLEQFCHHLEVRDKSPHSIRAYLSDLRQFAAWFAEHTGEPFTLEAVTEYDVCDWRDHLTATMKQTTVNRKLASLSVLYRWAGETGRVERGPTRYVNGIKQQHGNCLQWLALLCVTHPRGIYSESPTALQASPAIALHSLVSQVADGFLFALRTIELVVFPVALLIGALFWLIIRL
jgi:hypothetical protein